MDILLDEDYDLIIKDGDLVISEADERDIELILLLEKGSVRQSPLTGIGIIRYHKSPGSIKNITEFKATTRLQLEYDGFTTVEIKMNSFDDININAER